MPELIRDDICLRTILGLDYLWVDRLCILQDDQATKVPQLEAMRQIYYEAFVTLGTLERKSLYHGLFGVSRSRKPQLAIQLGPLALFPQYDVADDILTESTWSRCGWTNQEGAFPQKILMFGHDMVCMFQRPTGDDDEGMLLKGLTQHICLIHHSVARLQVGKLTHYLNHVE